MATRSVGRSLAYKHLFDIAETRPCSVPQSSWQGLILGRSLRCRPTGGYTASDKPLDLGSLGAHRVFATAELQVLNAEHEDKGLGSVSRPEPCAGKEHRVR